MIPNGRIDVDSDFAKKIGFTSDKFSSDSYLWGYPSYNGITIPFIESKKKGYFRDLIKSIEKIDVIFRILTPCNRMIEIALKQNWLKGFDGTCFFITNQQPEGE